ncbi:MAG TPA: hypothetical protein PLA44_08490, partial [Propionibacteriaceae bacterium]|nr:hypothetical protein [Propionibacteriaceae bacterium]
GRIIVLHTAPSSHVATPRPRPGPHSMRQIPLDLRADAARRFDTFVADGAQALLAHLQTIGPGSAPTYVWGPSGCGKSHLLEAWIHRRQQQGGRVAWFDASVATPWELPSDASPTILARWTATWRIWWRHWAPTPRWTA